MEANKATARVEAYGNKGLKNTPWRKTFKSYDALMAWAEKNSATVRGVRDEEASR
jgi:hypothetical protein